MRTPGRCTNHESCWLANGGRDIWVPVGDDFVCPVCAEPLTAPSLHSISMRSMAVAVAASLALVALAGGAGFGLVRAISLATHGAQGQLSAMGHAAPRMRAASPLPAAPNRTVAVASINPPAPAPAPPATPPQAVPKAAPVTPPAAPGAPAPTALARAAPKVASVPTVVPARPAPTTVAAATPLPAPVHPTPAIAPMVPQAASPPAAPRQIAEATPPAHSPQPQQALPQQALPPTAKPKVTQAGNFRAVLPSAGSNPTATENPESGQAAESPPPVPPVRPVPVSGPQPPAPRPVMVAQAITYGKPPGPEGESVDSTGRWRHRARRADRSGFLPGPGWSQSDDVTVSQATPPYQVAQGDTEENAPSAAAGFNDGTSVPNMQSDTEAAPNGATPADAAGLGQVPGIVPQMVPRFDGAAGAESAPEATPAMVTHLSVPWMTGRMQADVPAERVDVAAADAIDDAPDAPARLARLPPAPKAKLALPEYPPIAEDLDQPGRVDVGCTITVRGEPSDCAVTRQVGAFMFAQSVLSWLHSGEVRYRPHLEHGHPVPEARRYDVKFVP